MSKDNRTLIALSKNLDDDLSWRIKELTLFKSKVFKTFGFEQRALLRSSITMLYAHYEGFVKESATNYLNFVSLKGVDLGKLNSSFIALCLKSRFNFLQSNKIRLSRDVIEYLFDNLGSRSYVPYKSEINTKSNLNFEVFSDICILLSIDNSHYNIYRSTINSLVHKRNVIAHGKFILEDVNDYESYHDKIIEITNLFKNDIYNSAQLNKFKR